MRRFVLLVLAALCIGAWGAALYLATQSVQAANFVLPTLMVLPSETPTEFPTSASVSTSTSTDTPSTAAPTTAPSPTSTLAQRLLIVSASMLAVSAVPTTISLPADMVVLPAPPNPIEPLVDATDSAPPFLGWFSFESDYPTIHYDPDWLERFTPDASRGEYHRTDSPSGTATFAFEGEGLRVRYVAATNMGIFEISVDGKLLDTIDAYSDQLAYPGTQVYFVGSGDHLLQIQATGRKDDRSTGTVVGLDAIQIYRSNGNTTIIPPSAISSTPIATPQTVAQIQLVAAPATVQPTATPVSPRVITASVVIGYDENGNHAVDPAEGVNGISVRVVNTTNNQVVASGFTDATGYVDFQLVIDSPLQVVVPYFGKTWAIQTGNAAPTFTLLLNPGNQPGLIP